MHSLYAISLLSQTLRLVRVSSNQNTRWRLSFFFCLTDKGQEFICCFHPYHSWLSQYRRMVVSAPHIRDSGIKCFLKLYCTPKKKKKRHFMFHLKDFALFFVQYSKSSSYAFVQTAEVKKDLSEAQSIHHPRYHQSPLQIKLADRTPWWVLFSLFWMN
jgi:hypothetical protein